MVGGEVTSPVESFNDFQRNSRIDEHLTIEAQFRDTIVSNSPEASRTIEPTPTVTPTPTATPAPTITPTVTPTVTVTPSPLPSSCLDDVRVTCGSLTVGIENGTGIFANKGWGHSVSLNNTENYYAEFTPVSGIAHNSIHFGILETVHPPCLDYWNYGCVYRFDGKGFRNGVSVPAFFTAPAMAMGNTYGVLYRGSEQKVTFLKNNVDFQTVSLSIGAPTAPTNTVYKFWMFNVTDGMCTGNFGPSAAFAYNLSSLSADGVSVSARSIC